jgi:hypothetical protein
MGSLHLIRHIVPGLFRLTERRHQPQREGVRLRGDYRRDHLDSCWHPRDHLAHRHDLWVQGPDGEIQKNMDRQHKVHQEHFAKGRAAMEEIRADEALRAYTYHPNYLPPYIGPSKNSSLANGSGIPGWKPDRLDRSQYRFWDGAEWTDHDTTPSDPYGWALHHLAVKYTPDATQLPRQGWYTDP